LPHPSRTFHGRDVFAPVAAHLANGVDPAELGSPIDDPVRLATRGPKRRGNGEIEGAVIHVDRFGNLMTNVPGDWLACARWTCTIGDTSVEGPSETYAAVAPGEVLLLISSGGTAEVAVREGSAAARLNVRSGAAVIFRTS
jgi:S-adenosylmethionine hydrolase